MVLRSRAGDLYNTFQGDIARSPVGHCGLLAASLDLETLIQVVLAADDDPAGAALRQSPVVYVLAGGPGVHSWTELCSETPGLARDEA